MHKSLLFYSLSRRAHVGGLPRVGEALAALGRIATGAWVPGTARIGEGTVLAYLGSGVIIHSNACIGKRCNIGSGVVIGGRAGKDGVPVIGDDVLIASGAKVLGPVTIGDGAKIGPNAIVISDISAGATVVAPLGRVLGSDGEDDR